MSSEEAIIFWMINIETFKEIQQAYVIYLTADVVVFTLSNVICLMAGFCNIDSVKESIWWLRCCKGWH